MSKKCPLPASNPPTKPQPTDIEATQQNPPQAQALQSTQKSWVWKYFTPEPKANKRKHQVNAASRSGTTPLVLLNLPHMRKAATPMTPNGS
ncbi:hypothetical protein PCANC_06569 [Puccinia coronata f. sp. avenae]|uniref:Uncharacterized protein n=1 Tax=Puccinia coronata f. sp. avenae TaxID=200324 RepID=A0A2N5VA76_9BASI|nr:hypothetical protein PCANC_06569 [Puccinia coronata f. sp. avenae]